MWEMAEQALLTHAFLAGCSSERSRWQQRFSDLNLVANTACEVELSASFLGAATLGAGFILTVDSGSQF